MTVPNQYDDECDNADQNGRRTDQDCEQERRNAQTLEQTVENGDVLRHAGESIEDVVQYGKEKNAQHRCEEESPELSRGAPWMDEGEDEGHRCCQGQEDSGRIVVHAYEKGGDCGSTTDREEDQRPAAVTGRCQGLQHDHLTFRPASEAPMLSMAGGWCGTASSPIRSTAKLIPMRIGITAHQPRGVCGNR